MWTLYIDAMIELNTDLSKQMLLKQKCLLEAYKGGFEALCLTEKQYFKYVEILKKLLSTSEKKKIDENYIATVSFSVLKEIRN